MKLLSEHRLCLTQILITHGHLDHILAADELRQQTSAAIFMHQDDLVLWSRVQVQCQHFGVSVPCGNLPIIDCFVAHNDVVECGDYIKCRCIHTPGHTAGSVSWLVETAEYGPTLFSGDTLFAGSIGRTTWFGYPAMDNKSNARQLVSSIHRRLFDLPDKTVVICGHGAQTTIGKEKATNPFVGAGGALELCRECASGTCPCCRGDAA